MKLVLNCVLFTCFVASGAQAQISNFKHVVVLVQENRTPDNLFQGLCSGPFGSDSSCSTTPTLSQYNIQTSNWFDKTSQSGFTQPKSIALANGYDLDHSHNGFLEQCDMSQGAAGPFCRMDGASSVNCVGDCPTRPQFRFVKNKKGILDPYLQLATQYGWANYMFQSNQGPSFPAHQFLFGGTSAPSPADDAAGVFASSNMVASGGTGGLQVTAGCAAKPKTTVKLVKPGGDESDEIFPCFEHETLGDLLNKQVSPLSWRYYAPGPGTIWTAPNAIQHICESTGPGGQCTGQEWSNHIDLVSADILRDISACNLRNVTWVIPTCPNSDHANCTDGGGPSWIASIVNAIGNATSCDNGAGYWSDTAIFITWDDWGGWYDHEAPTILSGPAGSYQYGFRVPLIVVSAYTPKGLINNVRHDFGSLLRFIEQNFNIQPGALNFADARSQSDLTGFFNLSMAPRPFSNISSKKNAAFFLKDKRKQIDPDDQ